MQLDVYYYLNFRASDESMVKRTANPPVIIQSANPLVIIQSPPVIIQSLRKKMF